MSQLKTAIESLLFITNQPFSFKKLADLTKSDIKQVQDLVDELQKEYTERKGGIEIIQAGNSVQMVTSPQNSILVNSYIKEETTGELSKASLETLTIIAYRGPITKAELEQIRGVNCAVILRNLLMRGLIEKKDEKNQMSTTYNITIDFLKHLGISRQEQLPDYQKLNSSENLEKLLNPQQAAAENNQQ